MEKSGVIPIKLEGGGFLASVGYESVFATKEKMKNNNDGKTFSQKYCSILLKMIP